MIKNLISVILIILFVQFINVTPIYAEDLGNDIQFELISTSDDLKSLKPYYSVMADTINEFIMRANEAKDYGRDYPFLDAKELDFSSNPDIYGILTRNIYKTDMYNASINDIKEKAEFEYWDVKYLKNDVMYQFKLYDHDPLVECVKISDNWYLDDFSVFFLDQIEFTGDYRLYPEIVVENMNKLLPKSDRKSKIELIRTSANIYGNNCYIVYVDNKAKYVYCDIYILLSRFHSEVDYTEDATEDDKRKITHLDGMLYNNVYSDTHEIKKLYSYNMIVFITSYAYSKIDNIHEYD